MLIVLVLDGMTLKVSCPHLREGLWLGGIDDDDLFPDVRLHF